MHSISPALIWGVVGALLIIIELFSATFVALCIGLGALTTMIGSLLIPALSLTWQLALWGVSSALFTLLFFMLLKPRMTTRTAAGDPMVAVLGSQGEVITIDDSGHHGTIAFTQPLLGNRQWQCSSEAVLSPGQVAVVDNVDGNALIIHPIRPENDRSRNKEA